MRTSRRPRRPATVAIAPRPWALVVVAVFLAACGAPAASSSEPRSSAAPTQSPATPAPDVSKPTGVIAMGHSGLTGEGAGGASSEAMMANSWATGTSPEVNSVYLRLTAVRPETRDHVANTAEGGAPSSALPGQAESALQAVPVPALAIISTIDSDIRCDGSDAENIKPFGENVRAAMDAISKASPNTQILVVGQLGRPSTTFVAELIADHPDQKDSLTGSGPCDFFNERGELVAANFQTLTQIIESYEAEQARVCAQFPTCHTDGGVRGKYVDKLENFGPDFNHLNVAGQAAEAALIWPVVEDILGL